MNRRDRDRRAERMARRLIVLVSGASRPSAGESALAEEAGRLLAEAGAIVLTGGMGGVMEAASRGARSAGGTTIAVLPGRDAIESPPNQHVEIAIYTGMSEARNAILAHTADAVIAIGGGWGTLSEIALARRSRRPVVRLATWEIIPPGVATGRPLAGTELPEARSAAEAVRIALSSIDLSSIDPTDHPTDQSCDPQ